MSRITYVNGRYLPHTEAAVHVEDRGYQFSDGIYEVIAFYNRRLLDEAQHMARLARSLDAVQIAMPMSKQVLGFVMQEVIAANERTDGTLYIQITRGVAKRDHAFPVNARPSLILSVTGPKSPKQQEVRDGVSVITRPDERWARRDIKAISLLPNILAKQAAVQAQAREAWLVDGEGGVTEGSVSNNAIINGKNEIITHPADRNILGGVTRDVVLAIARKAGIKVVERAFTLKEALAAKEAFMTGTTTNVLPVVRIDGKAVGTGKPGPLTQKLITLYNGHIFKETGKRWS